MYSHSPEGYKCPMCYIAYGKEEPNFPYTRKADVIRRDQHTTSFVSSHWWPNNKGHIIIVPNEHFENIYDIPTELLGIVAQASKYAALALKETYHCDGVTTRQHNEPAGNQDVWHLHQHVFPRYKGDQFYETTYMPLKANPEIEFLMPKNLKDILIQ